MGVLSSCETLLMKWVLGAIAGLESRERRVQLGL